MKSYRFKTVSFFSKLALAMIVLAIFFLFAQEETNAQERSIFSQTDTVQKSQSPFNVGFSIGYTGIPNNSPLTSDVVGNNIVNGMSAGFHFEYNFKSSKLKLQFLTEGNRMNFEKDGKDSYEYISFNTIGIKIPVLMFYITPAVGIMTGRETQFIRSFHIGHEFLKERNSSTFIQIGVAETDFQDIFLKINFGTNFNL